MTYHNTQEFADEMDAKDLLKEFRDQFFIPRKNGEEVIYLTGNSLGLQPKNARQFLEEEMKKWEEFGVDGHFGVKNQWFDYHKLLKKPLANLVGAGENEVTVMNGLTVNVHLMMVSFYQPNAKRNKILIEKGAFPSDQYVVESQAGFHGFSPESTVVEIAPRSGEYTLRTEDILQKIEALGEELALVMMGGVNYYTGQFFDLARITHAGHQAGAYVGFDLAHAVGNIPLELHTWDIDFAMWCSYKYLNSSPGGVSGVFVHEKHIDNTALPRFAGWWGYEEETRFLMQKGFKPAPDVDAWQLSNVPVLLLAVHRASLELFEKAGIQSLRRKSEQLTGFLEFVIRDVCEKEGFAIQIITPSDPARRGCQLSLIVEKDGKKVFDWLEKNGVVADWREPDVIRIAPVPLYNRFEEMHRFGQILQQAIG